MAKNVRVFEADLSGVVPGIYAPLLGARGVSGRAQGRIARTVREAIRKALLDTVIDAYRDGSAPYRTGNARNVMRYGVRAFGQTFTGLRGHIIGPDYIAAHENGATILPKKAKALAIPLPAAQRPDGSPKLPGPRSWRNIRRTFIYKSRKTGKAYIAFKGASGRLTLLYVLVDSVTLSKYSGFLARSWERQIPDIVEALGNALFFEMSQVDLLSLARVTYKGRKN